MNGLTITGILFMIIGIALFAWGTNYTDQHGEQALFSMFGHRDSTYEAAGYCVLGGEILSVLGLGLVIGGIALHVRSKSKPQFPSNERATRRCPRCESHVNTESRFCDSCGMELGQSASMGTNCTECGARLDPGCKFCDNCGARLPT